MQQSERAGKSSLADHFPLHSEPRINKLFAKNSTLTVEIRPRAIHCRFELTAGSIAICIRSTHRKAA